MVNEPLGERFIAVVAVIRQGRDVPTILRKWSVPIRRELVEIRARIERREIRSLTPATVRSRRKKKLGRKARAGGRDADPRSVILSYAPLALPFTAASILATSIFFIGIIASNARLATSPPRAIASVSTRGVICQDKPHLSLHQPH